MPYFQVESGVNLFYEVRGEGKPVLFVHGWTMSHDVWEYQVSELAKKYQTIVVDLRGNGDSDKPWGSYSYETYARDLHSLIEHLGLKDITFVGWSMGGAIGIQYLLQYKHKAAVSRLISVDGVVPVFVESKSIPFGQPRTKVEQWLQEERQRRPDFTKEFVDSMFYAHVGEYTKLWIWDITMKTSWHVAIQSLETLRDTDFTKELSNIKTPVAVFHGVHDRVVPYDLGKVTVSKLSNAKLTSFQNSGHVPFIEEKDKFNQELIRFIESTTKMAESSKTAKSWFSWRSSN